MDTPITTRPLIGIGVLIINENDEILLGKRKGTLGDATWGPPGGHLEFGETFEECAIREVMEETGLAIVNPQFLAITNDLFARENKHYVSIFMTAKNPKSHIVINCEPAKIEEWKWFKKDTLPAQLFLPLKQLITQKSYGKKGVSERSYFSKSLDLMRNKIRDVLVKIKCKQKVSS